MLTGYPLKRNNDGEKLGNEPDCYLIFIYNFILFILLINYLMKGFIKFQN